MKRSASISKDSPSTASGAKISHGRLIVWISILLTGLFPDLALRGLDWGIFSSPLRNANYASLPLIRLWSGISNCVRAPRWRVPLTAQKRIPAQYLFWANMAGSPGSNIPSARAGELICAAPLHDALQFMPVFGMVGISTPLPMPNIECRRNRIPVIRPILPTPAKERFGAVPGQFLRGVEALRHPYRPIGFILFTSLIWLLDGIGIMIPAHALHFRFTFSETLFLLAAPGLSRAMPSTPGYVGAYQFAAVLAPRPFGFSRAEAIALVLFTQFFNLVVLGFWGMTAIARFAKSKSGASL